MVIDAVDTLAALVSQTLVRIDESDPDEPRFRMLETVRAYAAERLAERGEIDATVARLARYLIGVVQTVRDDLQGPSHRAAAERLDRERDEIRSAIDWASRWTTPRPSAGSSPRCLPTGGAVACFR